MGLEHSHSVRSAQARNLLQLPLTPTRSDALQRTPWALFLDWGRPTPPLRALRIASYCARRRHKITSIQESTNMKARYASGTLVSWAAKHM